MFCRGEVDRQNSQRAKEPKSQRAKEPKSQRAKEPKSQRAKEPKSQRAKEPKSQRAKEPKSRQRVPELFSQKRGLRDTLALATMTASTYDLLKQEMKWGTVTTNFVPDLSRIGVSGVSYNENTKAYSYTLSYEGIKRHFTSVGEGLTEAVERSVFVETRMLEYPRDLTDMFYAQSRKELVKAKEELGAKIFTDIISGGMISSFSKADTLIGAAAQAFYSMVQSDYGTAANSAYTVVKETDKAAHPRMIDGEEVPIPKVSQLIESEATIFGVAGARAVLNYRKNVASLNSSIKNNAFIADGLV